MSKVNVLNKQDILSIMKKHAVKGISLAVIENYQIKFSAGLGKCDDRVGSNISDGTLFQVASISKPVFSVAVMKMAEQGLIDLEEDVTNKLPNFKLTSIVKEKLTLELLLSHNGGINVGGFDGYKQDQPVPSTLEILCGLGNSEKIERCLKAYSYSGGGFTVAQYYIESLFPEKSYSEIMQELVFKPLNMKNSLYYPDINESTKLASENYNIYPEFAAAGLYTTAKDIASLGIAIQKSLLGLGLLSKGVASRMLTRVKDGYHGLGFRVSPDGKNFWHGGINNSFYSHCIFTKDGRGVVILTNSNSRNFFDELENYIKEKSDWTDITLNSFNSK